MSFLLDTSVVIAYFRRDQAVIDDLRSRRHQGLAVSAVSVGELYEGVFLLASPSRSAAAELILVEFLSEISVLPVDDAIGRLFGQERARLRRAGNPMSDIDLLIAATALHHGLTLLTSDRDFERLEQLQSIFL